MPVYWEPQFGLTDYPDLNMVAVVTQEGETADAALLDKAQAISDRRCAAGRAICSLAAKSLCEIDVQHNDIGGNGMAQTDIFEVVCKQDCVLLVAGSFLDIDHSDS
jgi:hypothetical protein